MDEIMKLFVLPENRVQSPLPKSQDELILWAVNKSYVFADIKVDRNNRTLKSPLRVKKLKLWKNLKIERQNIRAVVPPMLELIRQNHKRSKSAFIGISRSGKLFHIFAKCSADDPRNLPLFGPISSVESKFVKCVRLESDDIRERLFYRLFIQLNIYKLIVFVGHLRIHTQSCRIPCK